MGRGASKAGGNATLTSRDIVSSIVGGDSYTNDLEYAATAKSATDAFGRMREIDDEQRELEKQLKEESRPKPADEWDTQDQIMAMLGDRPMIYTEKGQAIYDKMSALSDEKKALNDKWQKNTEKIKKVDNEQSKIQKELYLKQPAAENTISANVKDSYKGFKVSESRTPYVDDALKNGRAFVVEMSPKQYLQEVAYKIFDSATLETALRGTSTKSVQNYMSMMKKGVKFDTPYLNYRDEQQEGRHRAIAAHMLGYKKIPVIIMR